MKKVLFLLSLLLLYVEASAQEYSKQNSISRKALVYYYMDENGFFQKKENNNLEWVDNVVSAYGYDKKSHELYVTTHRSNCVIIVSDDLHKVLKKSKSIPQLKSDELMAKANEVNAQFAKVFEQKNMMRRKHLADSVERVRQDSIKKALEDSLRIVAEQQKEEAYRKSHKFFFIPTKKNSIYCDFCEKSIETSDSVGAYGIKNDTIYWMGNMEGYLYNYYKHIHAGKVPTSLKNDALYQYHYKVFKDSLENDSQLSKEYAKFLNALRYLNYLDEVQKEAPNGFFLSWGWDDDYSNIKFHFNYMNTNKNTIKYIEVFFVVTNDVGDVRKTGSFKGTGPVETWESASWDWDHSGYYVAGDASKMNISKVIITYMNGSKVTIPKNKLKFN